MRPRMHAPLFNDCGVVEDRFVPSTTAMIRCILHLLPQETIGIGLLNAKCWGIIPAPNAIRKTVNSFMRTGNLVYQVSTRLETRSHRSPKPLYLVYLVQVLGYYQSTVIITPSNGRHLLRQSWQKMARLYDIVNIKNTLHMKQMSSSFSKYFLPPHFTTAAGRPAIYQFVLFAWLVFVLEIQPSEYKVQGRSKVLEPSNQKQGEHDCAGQLVLTNVDPLDIISYLHVLYTLNKTLWCYLR